MNTEQRKEEDDLGSDSLRCRNLVTGAHEEVQPLHPRLQPQDLLYKKFRYESGGARDEDRLAVKALRDPGGFHGEQDANGVLGVSRLSRRVEALLACFVARRQ